MTSSDIGFSSTRISTLLIFGVVRVVEDSVWNEVKGKPNETHKLAMLSW
jgi:hypothetical protein